ncbi:hypothetical protein BC567DRAFT_221964 [Phyllosticta citribraziliensis]
MAPASHPARSPHMPVQPFPLAPTPLLAGFSSRSSLPHHITPPHRNATPPPPPPPRAWPVCYNGDALCSSW